MKQHIVIYNCVDESISKEIVAIDTIKHVWLSLPDRERVVIEYINPASGGVMSITEYYKNRNEAESRVCHLIRMLCGEKFSEPYWKPITCNEAEE